MSVCMYCMLLSLSGPKAKAKAIGPILFEFAQNLYLKGQNRFKKFFDKSFKISPRFCPNSLFFDKL